MYHYPFHISDFRSSTAHLSDEEELCYRRLLDMYYDSEAPIRRETEWVARRLRLGSEVVMTVLREFFEECQDGWHHERCDRLITSYQSRAHTARANGSLGGRPSKTQSVSRRNPTLTQPKPGGKLTSNQEPVTSNQEPSPNPASDDTGVPKKKQERSIPAKQPKDVTDDTWSEWTAHRRRKSASISVGVIRTARKKAKELGMSLETLLEKWTFSGQQGCYVTNNKQGSLGPSGRPLVPTSKMHTPNMPRGHPHCDCSECVAFRAKQGDQP